MRSEYCKSNGFDSLPLISPDAILPAIRAIVLFVIRLSAPIYFHPMYRVHVRAEHYRFFQFVSGALRPYRQDQRRDRHAVVSLRVYTRRLSVRQAQDRTDPETIERNQRPADGIAADRPARVPRRPT